jgi:ferredoxin-type protein NapH
VNGLSEKKRAPRKAIRYFRWLVKAFFLLIFTLPIAYFATAPPLPVYSLINGGLNQPPLLTLPYGESVCSLLLFSYDNIGPGAWLICPSGGLQVLLTGKVTTSLLLPTIIAIILFLIPIFFLGNVFCGWACPIGTVIDAFDKGVERFMPNLNIKREKRTERRKEKKIAEYNVCPTCPFGKLLAKINVTLANGVLVTALVGSAFLQFPVFCALCPIGIMTKGMFHLKLWTSITGRMMPILIELAAIPVIAIIASLWEKRYWCRQICPVGASLNLAGAFGSLLKPTVKADKCIMKGCPETCEDYHLDYCGVCRQVDQKRCERFCPQDIELLEGDSLVGCTKCFECYVECEHDAMEIKLFGTPDAVLWFKRLRAKLKRQSEKHLC